MYSLLYCFSFPELKAQVKSSDHLFSVVVRVCRFFRLSLTFSRFHLQRQRTHFQHPWHKALLGDDSNKIKMCCRYKKKTFYTNHTNHLLVDGISVCSNDGPHLYLKGECSYIVTIAPMVNVFVQSTGPISFKLY